MKKRQFSVFSISLLFLSQAVFAQHAATDSLRLSRKQTSSTQKILPPTQTVAQLLLSLQNATAVKMKTDLLYDIAAAYLNNLKVDSALFYAQRIKELADVSGYEEGLGNYYLAKAGASFLRSKGEEVKQYLAQAILLFSKYKKGLYLGLSYRLMARQAGQENNNMAAQQYYRKAIGFITAAKNENYLQRTVYEFGRNFFFSYETDSAVIYLSRSLKMAEQMQSSPRIFSAAAMLGAVHF